MNQITVDLGQLNIEEINREMKEKETDRMLSIIMENNIKILVLQSILVLLLKNEERKKQEKEQ